MSEEFDDDFSDGDRAFARDIAIDLAAHMARAITIKNMLSPQQRTDLLMHMGYTAPMAAINAPHVDREALAARMRADTSDTLRNQLRARAEAGLTPPLHGMNDLLQLFTHVAAEEDRLEHEFTAEETGQIVALAKQLWSQNKATATGIRTLN